MSNFKNNMDEDDYGWPKMEHERHDEKVKSRAPGTPPWWATADGAGAIGATLIIVSLSIAFSWLLLEGVAWVVSR